MTRIGVIEQLWRYPVKSMRGESLTQARVTFTGLVGDRVWALVANTPDQPDFPWHTAREQPELLLYSPQFRNPDALIAPYPAAQDFAIDVTTPDGRCYDLQDPEFLQHLHQRAGCDFWLRFSEKGAQDARPISLISTATLSALGAETGHHLDPQRFRPNFYVRWDQPTPFFEDQLVGKRLGIGDRLEISIVKKDPRCIIITMNPDDASSDPLILKNLARHHAGSAGVYAAVLREGELSCGMEICLLD